MCVLPTVAAVFDSGEDSFSKVGDPSAEFKTQGSANQMRGWISMLKNHFHEHESAPPSGSRDRSCDADRLLPEPLIDAIVNESASHVQSLKAEIEKLTAITSELDRRQKSSRSSSSSIGDRRQSRGSVDRRQSRSRADRSSSRRK